jgi:hypothetical protein
MRHTTFEVENLERRDSEDQGVDGSLVLKRNETNKQTNKQDVSMLTGFIWLREGYSDGLL